MSITSAALKAPMAWNSNWYSNNRRRLYRKRALSTKILQCSHDNSGETTSPPWGGGGADTRVRKRCFPECCANVRTLIGQKRSRQKAMPRESKTMVRYESWRNREIERQRKERNENSLRCSWMASSSDPTVSFLFNASPFGEPTFRALRSNFADQRHATNLYATNFRVSSEGI